MISRAQVLFPLYTRDRYAVLEWAQVQVYEEDGITPFRGTLYRSRTGAATLPNPFVASPALIRFHLDQPDRIVLGYRTDRSETELKTRVIDPWVDADELVTTIDPLWIAGVPLAGGLLRAENAGQAYWFQPGLSPHPHVGYAPGSTRIGPDDAISARIASYPNTTSIGAANAQLFANPQHFYTWGQLMQRAGTYRELSFHQWAHWAGSIVLAASADLTGATMLGFGSFGIGGQVAAAGGESYAADGTPTPYVQGSLAVGYQARAFSGSIAVGRQARSSRESDFIAADEQGLISLGRNTGGTGERAISLGALAQGSQDGLALGFAAGGLTDPPETIVLGGVRITPEALALPPSSSVRLPSALRAAQEVSLGHSGSQIGFYGAQGTTQPIVGEHEPGSGIPALDSLIRALRTLGLLQQRIRPILRYDAEQIQQAAEWPGETGILRLENGAATIRRDASLNGRAALVLSASTRLVEQEPHSTISSYVVVAEHPGIPRTGETLLSLETDDSRATVLSAASTASPVTRGTWKPTMSAYERDGLDQTANRGIGTGAHVHRVQLTGDWPPAPLVLGKPDGLDPGWTGGVAEVLGVDRTWSERDQQDLTAGLMFKYGIGQRGDALIEPALARIVAGQEPGDVYVDLDHRFGLARPYPVSGTVRSPSPLPTKVVAGKAVPDASVRIYTTLDGERTLAETVPLRTDYTWFGVVRAEGFVTTELVNDAGTRLDDDRVLPPTTDGMATATVRGLALIVLALLRQPARYHFRAELILRTLAGLQEEDGSLAQNVTLATGEAAGMVVPGSLALAGMAALRYAEVTGDPQFAGMATRAGDFLRTRLTGLGLVLSADNETSFTTDAALTYLLWRGLGWTGEGSPGEQLRQALESAYWLAAEGRPAFSVTTTTTVVEVTNPETGEPENQTDVQLVVDPTHTLWTDLWMVVCLQTLGWRERSLLVQQAMASFRIRSAEMPE